MKHYSSNEIKNVVLAGSSRAGKTTLAECMMFEGGVINRMGSVEDGNTVSDYHEIETSRGHSVFSAIMHTAWRGTKLNLIDTPGMDDFIGELIGALRVADTALVTLNAQHGVEVGTEIVWRYLSLYEKPSVFVVNQMDHPKADFFMTLDQLQAQFGPAVTVMQYPYNQGDGFNAIIDLLKMVMYQFPAGGGKPEKHPIPEAEKNRAEAWHKALVEAAASHDETLMEIYFEKGELDEDEMRQGIRLGMLSRNIFPVFCLSAKRNMGSGRLMGFLGNVAPTASEMGPERTTSDQPVYAADPDTTLFIFKAANEKHAGAMSYFKVCSGELVTGAEFFNNLTGNSAKLNQLYCIDGKNRIAVNRLSAGDIGATVKLRDAHVNHTLRSRADGVILAPIIFPDPKITYAIVPDKQADEEKMAQALARMADSDPTLILSFDRETHQNLLHGQGDLHLMTARWALSHQHGIEVSCIEPRVAYRETIQRPAEGVYKHKKQSGGAGQFAEVALRIAPWHEGMADPPEWKVKERQETDLPWGGKLVFCNCIVGGVIENRFMPAILKGVMEVMENGPVTHSHARDVIVYVYDGKMHPVDSNEISFKLAGQQAFKQAFLAASPRLMEPVYRVEVLTPDLYVGEIMTDFATRRAIVEGMEHEGTYQRIIARAPMAELHRYATALSAMTQGRATFSRQFLEYVQVPAEIQQRVSHAQPETAAS